jgi:hypothetical protein
VLQLQFSNATRSCFAGVITAILRTVAGQDRQQGDIAKKQRVCRGSGRCVRCLCQFGGKPPWVGAWGLAARRRVPPHGYAFPLGGFAVLLTLGRFLALRRQRMGDYLSLHVVIEFFGLRVTSISTFGSSGAPLPRGWTKQGSRASHAR